MNLFEKFGIKTDNKILYETFSSIHKASAACDNFNSNHSTSLFDDDFCRVQCALQCDYVFFG